MWKPDKSDEQKSDEPLPEDRLAQFFETSIGDRRSGRIFRAIVVPSSSLEIKEKLLDAETLLDMLGLDPISPIEPQFLAKTIAAALERPTTYGTNELMSIAEEIRLGHFHPSRGGMFLAERVVAGQYIPFQQSPLELHSLKEVIAKGSATAIGAYVGFVALGSHPLVLIFVPAGIVLCGAAYGVAKALEEGLQYRLLGLMGVPAVHRKKTAPPSGSGGSGKGKPPKSPGAGLA